jgi:hypothetical protein
MPGMSAGEYPVCSRELAIHAPVKQSSRSCNPRTSEYDRAHGPGRRAHPEHGHDGSGGTASILFVWPLCGRVTWGCPEFRVLRASPFSVVVAVIRQQAGVPRSALLSGLRDPEVLR